MFHGQHGVFDVGQQIGGHFWVLFHGLDQRSAHDPDKSPGHPQLIFRLFSGRDAKQYAVLLRRIRHSELMKRARHGGCAGRSSCVRGGLRGVDHAGQDLRFLGARDHHPPIEDKGRYAKQAQLSGNRSQGINVFFDTVTDKDQGID